MKDSEIKRVKRMARSARCAEGARFAEGAFCNVAGSIPAYNFSVLSFYSLL